MSTSATAALAVRGRTGRANARTVEIAVPPHRAAPLHPVAGALRSSTVLVVAPGHAAWAPLTAGMLEMGIGRVLRAESAAAVDAIIAQRSPGDLALVSTALGGKTRKIVRKLRAAGWHRVLALATGTDPAPLISAVLTGEDADLGVRVRGRDADLHPSLSRRQVAILRCLADGLSVKRISHELGVSRSAVKRHLRQIGVELGAPDQGAMVAAGAASV